VDGVYSAGSGYEAQFHGRCLELNLEYVWKIRAEARREGEVLLMAYAAKQELDCRQA
jgi:hypothetical protein